MAGGVSWRAEGSFQTSTSARRCDCRHTYATLALEAGRSLRFVAEQLGYSNPALTLRQYAHALPLESGDLEFADFDTEKSGSKRLYPAPTSERSLRLLPTNYSLIARSSPSRWQGDAWVDFIQVSRLNRSYRVVSINSGGSSRHSVSRTQLARRTRTQSCSMSGTTFAMKFSSCSISSAMGQMKMRWAPAS